MMETCCVIHSGPVFLLPVTTHSCKEEGFRSSKTNFAPDKFFGATKMSLLQVFSDTKYNAGRKMKGDVTALTLRNHLWFPDASGDVVSVMKDTLPTV